MEKLGEDLYQRVGLFLPSSEKIQFVVWIQMSSKDHFLSLLEEAKKNNNFEQLLSEAITLTAERVLKICYWAVEILAKYTFSKFFSSSFPEKLQASKIMVMINADHYTALNFRKKVLQESKEWEEELKFCSLVLTKYPKGSEIWNQRRWVFKQWFPQLIGQNFVQKIETELVLCNSMAKQYPKNYYCWNHRRWVFEQLSTLAPESFEKIARNDLQQLSQWITEDPSDHSVLHHRSFLLRMLQNQSLITSEFDCLDFWILSFPGHDSLWLHRRAIWHLWVETASNLVDCSLTGSPDLFLDHFDCLFNDQPSNLSGLPVSLLRELLFVEYCENESSIINFEDQFKLAHTHHNYVLYLILTYHPYLKQEERICLEKIPKKKIKSFQSLFF